jgi:N-acyl-D-amino-acid deacylase
MKNIFSSIISTGLLILILFSGCNNERFDIVIENGTVYDGTGNSPVRSDIGIFDGRIARIGENLQKKGATIIDASGLIVAPGFIDIHTHCDGQVLQPGMNSMKNYLTQGVSTVVGGNCGGGTWKVEKFFSRLDSIGIGANMVHLAGHNTMRREVMGMEDRQPTAAELDEMKLMLKSAMDEGAAGLSTGLFYLPGAYSSPDEVIELAKVVKTYDGFYATHMRDESNYTVGLKESVKEAINVGEKTGVRVEIAHIKALGRPVWGMSGEIIDLIKEARERGINIFADQYPYNASNTGLSGALLKSWVWAGGQLRSRLKDPELLPRIKKETGENIERRGGPESIVIVSYPPDTRFDGKSLAEISTILGKKPVETALHLILENSPSIVSFNMQDADILNFMKEDFVMTGSDGSLVNPGQGVPHPRSYGTFPRKIKKYALEEKVITLEEAIKKSTSMPAEMIGLKDRGTIKEGNIADIVLLNLETIQDNATFADPHHYSTGIEYLIINGDIVIEKGEYNGKLSGKGIRINRPQTP